jgi:hypothetical protein
MERRTFLAAATLVTAAGASAPASFASDETFSGPKLKYRVDGGFKILAFGDQHCSAVPNPQGIALIKKLIALEEPDLVIACGDNVEGKACATPDEVKKAVGNVAEAMEDAMIPWAVVLGNHDREHFPKTKMADDRFFALFESYPHNVNGGWVRDISGTGNKCLPIWTADGSRRAFNIWLVDSGKGSSDPDLNYEWIRTDQVAWYVKTSTALEKRHGGKSPGLMFFHIPLQEYQQMILTKLVVGDRFEPECPSRVNGGMYAALLERGDVMGTFCGHDHSNNYMGFLRKLALGYVGVPRRGARIVQLNQAMPGKFETWMRFIDGTSAWKQLSAELRKAEESGVEFDAMQ